MTSEVLTGQKHLLLNPRYASLYDIFSVLFTEDVESKDFVHSYQVTAILERRGVLFISLLLQKILLHNESIIARLGSRIEMSLNVMTNTRNLSMFLKNIIRGKVVTPDKNLASFVSAIGLLDDRLELDKTIEPGTQKYFATLCAMASKLAYENDEFIKYTVEKVWKMNLLGTYNFWDERYKGYTTQCLIFQDKYVDPNVIIVAFRGTEPFNADDWCTDFDISFTKLPNINGKVHIGFMKALGLQQDGTWPIAANAESEYAYHAITDEIKRHLNISSGTKFIVTGHSLGGALSVLFPSVLAQHNESKILERLQGVYTFGQPRVGDRDFGIFMKEQFERYGIEYCRFVYSHDVVPRIPFDDSALMFKHFGKCIYINSLYEAMVVEEEPMKNYLEWGVSFFTTRIDALWELVRSFVLPYMVGPEYKETLLQQMFRVVGLFFPGFTAHGPRDYINATRLAVY